MPECAEVRINAEQILPHLKGAYVHGVQIHPTSRYKSIPPVGMNDLLNEIKSGKKIFIEDIKTSGKFLYWVFSDNWFLMNTLGMTGQWSRTPNDNPCISIQYTHPPTRAINSIFFNDHRHFGTIKFTNDKKEIEKKLKKLGWNPFDGIQEDTIKKLKKKLIGDERNIAQVLLDQKVINGTGNYLKSEILYAAQISPHRPAHTLSESEIYTLCEKTIETVQASYEQNGATLNTYTSPNGEKGNFSSFFKVYKRKEDPMGNPVKKEELKDGRTTYWVPVIQK